MGEVFSMANKIVYLCIKQETFVADEVKQVDELTVDTDKIKSKAQRLRAVLYLNFKQDPQGFPDFDAYYAHFMERMIDHWKSKLEE